MIARPLMLAALVFALYLVSAGGTNVAAQETTTIRGQVVNGTAGADLPDGLGVLMLISGAGEALAGTGQTTADAQGQFVFNDVQIQDGDNLTVSVEHLGVFYGVSLTAEELKTTDELVLTVYETTNDASIIRVERQVMVIAAVDRGEQLVSAVEFVRVLNPTDQTLMPDLANVPPISFLRFALPPDAAELKVQSDLPGGDVATIGTGFALTSPVMPGSHSIDFSYAFPYGSATLSYRKTLPQGAGIFQVLVPDSVPDLAVSELDLIDSVNIQGTSYRTYEGRNYLPGQGLDLEITGLPMPGVWQRLSSSVSEGTFWQNAIPIALGAVLATMLLWGLIRGYRPAPAAVADANRATVPVDRARRTQVVRAVAALDQSFQKGGVSEADYRNQRQELVARILGPGAIPDKEPAEDRPE
ncbi:MAG: hypothetical protein O3A93_05490 [Chloroflexi bacterium]|nr:hypothetical protein [Chloroflexota bacterium]MDA1270696.1 hypothetical protein [Chloroflexota bacterium]PKB59556.1 MAG: hypothetical protein BZY83_01205 [SAR202 cluster bacterium Casp-Chloro-G2]